MAFRESSTGGFAGFVVRGIFRFLMLIFALAVAGLYGTDLNNAQKANKAGDPKWIYAVVVASLSAITAVVYMIPFVKSHVAFAWDALLFILWVAVFGRMYINEDPEGDGGVQRMKNAVWIDLINMLLWFFSAIFGGVVFFRSRGGKSLHTGRATV
ncbi:MAG: hypothetical protein M1833_001630 [Piccolia ochrophora]|nr:MAG: hypothetical protein M1833_001630 [Piccolia ochrophora]